MYCLGCGYCLDGLTEPRCPACARPFGATRIDLGPVGDARPQSRRPGLFLFFLSMLGLVMIAYSFVGAKANGLERNFSWAVLGLLVHAYVVICGAFCVFIKRYRASPYFRAALMAALIPIGGIVFLICTTSISRN